MSDVTQILDEIDHGDEQAAEKLLPLVYAELRKLAAARLAGEAPGQTLQATALVHEAFVRLVDVPQRQQWNSRGHFFAAAAEAMRRILVENARRKRSLKRGGDRARLELCEAEIAAPAMKHDVLLIDEALERLDAEDPQAATLVKLRYFSGLTMEESAQALGMPLRSAQRLWTWSRAWLLSELQPDAGSG
ncbi:ECF sigma factor [Maioricimonas rarisocia]|uniref:ECF sigma factor n=1 Tax=Maioricimonas rarisocia TaxID=2528026 RepID=A0A517Z2J0_9PLAN|nr:sigma-70 family RNA polymerase sigma factor [Maioricimonas rarisocia]QDU36703.1 ECF sigma factor [Maioricimonas rarisocia]